MHTITLSVTRTAYWHAFIGMLENQGTDAALIYTSDHGEDIFDDPRHLFLHASPVPSYYQLHIPFSYLDVRQLSGNLSRTLGSCDG